MNRIYSTKEIADLTGIHPNTVRFYEEIGFLTEPGRKSNGYRIYTRLQLEQCRLVRLAMRAEVLQNGLRKKAVEIVRLCAELELDRAINAAEQYRAMISGETENAHLATVCVERMLGETVLPDDPKLTRKAAAKLLGLTPETLRTWERSGLISVGRGQNGYRVYSAQDIERLGIIRTLRCANYSLSAILRLLTGLDAHCVQSVEKTLNTPRDDEEIVSVCDRLILSLNRTAADADEILILLKKIKSEYTTLQ